MPTLLPIGRKALPHSQFELQWLCDIHQRTQFNVWQPNSMTLLSIGASDLRIMIQSVHSLNSLSLLNFSTAHTTHPKYRFRHPRPKTVSSFFPVSFPGEETEDTQLFNPSEKTQNLIELLELVITPEHRIVRRRRPQRRIVRRLRLRSEPCDVHNGAVDRATLIQLFRTDQI
jgi:hypothetical protein